MTGQYKNIDTLPTISSYLRYEDMGVATGGLARGTDIDPSDGFVTTYAYSGCGVFIGFLVTLEDQNRWEIRLEIDGQQILSVLTNDLRQSNVYGYDFDDREDMEPGRLGFYLSQNTVYFEAPQNSSIPYNSSVIVQLRKASGDEKEFRGGLAVLTKEV